MKVIEGELDGVLIFSPEPAYDERGSFTRTFDRWVAAAHGLDSDRFVQDSQSRSHRGVIRGLHFRIDGGESKLVRCARGAVHDVAVDLRPWSSTFGAVQQLRIDDEQHITVFLPAGLAHGFQVLSDLADVCYRIDRGYDPTAGATLYYADPDLHIDWPLPVTEVSMNDRHAPGWSDLQHRFPDWFPAPAEETIA